MRTTPELALFRLALRQSLGTADAEAPQGAGTAVLDWPAIVRGAQRHNLAPTILAGLQSGDVRLPPQAAAWLNQAARQAEMRDRLQTHELERLMPELSGAGVAVLVLKGLTLTLGGGVARGSMDVDLLVAPGQFAQADKILVAAGYRSLNPSRSPHQARVLRELRKEDCYVHAVHGTPIELHTRLFSNPALLPFDFQTLWTHRAEVRIGEARVATLGRPHLALYLTAHGAVHGWMRLRWLVDLATILQRVDLEEIGNAAKREGLEAALHHALILARDWLHLPVPAHMLSAARADRRAKVMNRIVARFYAGQSWCRSPSPAARGGFLRFSLWLRLHALLLKPGRRYLLGQLRREWATPADWALVRLPDPLFFAYAGVRPFGFLIRRWRYFRSRRP